MFIRAELFESDEIVVVRCQNIAVAGVRDWGRRTERTWDGSRCRKAFVPNNEMRAAMLEKVKPSRFAKKTCTTA